MAVIEMSVADWIDVRDNPRQRDTERRANYAKTKHLARYEQPHRFVFAAVKDGTILCKLDGHTRSLLWQLGELESPPDGKVVVCLIDVRSLKEAAYYYDCLDAPKASKKPSDMVFGATRENKFRLRSALLRSCSFSTQLKIADSGKKFSGEIYELVAKWKPTLLQLDSLDLSSKYTILISAMLVTINKDGVKTAGEFWRLLDSDLGTKDKRGMDGVEALNQHIMLRRSEGRMAGYENLYDILCRSITAYNAWKDGVRVRTLAASDMKEFFGKPMKTEVTSCQ